MEISNDHAVESSVASFCGRDHYSSFQTCFEDMPARHASLNGMQNGSRSKHTRKFWFCFQCHIPRLSQEVGRMKQLCTGVMLPQCIVGAGSWREQMKELCMMKIVRMLFSVIEDFIVIVV